MRYKLTWIVILLLAFILRAYRLDLNPVGLSHDDELHEIINAKSLAKTGFQSPGTVAGIFSKNNSCQGNCVYGELGSFILTPWMMIFPLDMTASKIPFVLASLGIVFFGGRLLENLSRSSKVGLLTGLLLAVNPWEIHFGRTAYFTTFSYTFYLIAAYFYTKNFSYKLNLVSGTIFSILASFFYFGTKPILPFIILWGVLYNFYRFKKHHLKFTFVLLGIVALIISGYILVLSNSYAGRRIKEIGIDTSEIKRQTDEQRRISLDIPLVRDITINRYTVQANILTEKYLGFLNPVFLYVKSTGSTDIYYTSNHAYNYLIDFPFLIIGLIALGTVLPNGLFLLGLITISILPTAFKITGDTIYTLRAGLAYPLLTGITGWGIIFLYDKFKKFKRAFLILLILIYVLSVLYFLIMYWYKTPFEKSMGWYHHKRILVNYIQRLKQSSNKEVMVVTAQPADTFNTYVFYSGLYNSTDKIKEINAVYKSQNYIYNGIKFIDSCEKVSKDEIKNKIIFIEQTVKCKLDQNTTSKIANPRDGGGIYNIINESLCSPYQLNKYPNPRNLADFKVEGLTNEDFCHLWITNPDK